MGVAEGEGTEVVGAIPGELIEPLLSEISIPVGPGQLRRALEIHARQHDVLLRVRSIPLQYSPTYVEPLTALRWIENGGHTVE
jgi:hypothetical protein